MKRTTFLSHTQSSHTDAHTQTYHTHITHTSHTHHTPHSHTSHSHLTHITHTSHTPHTHTSHTHHTHHTHTPHSHITHTSLTHTPHSHTHLTTRYLQPELVRATSGPRVGRGQTTPHRSSRRQSSLDVSARSSTPLGGNP